MISNDVMEAASRRLGMGGCNVGPMIDKPVDGGISMKAQCSACSEWREVIVAMDAFGRSFTSSVLPKCPGMKLQAAAPAPKEPEAPPAPPVEPELPPAPPAPPIDLELPAPYAPPAPPAPPAPAPRKPGKNR